MSVFDFGWFEKGVIFKKYNDNENAMSHDVHKYPHGLSQYVWTEKETEKLSIVRKNHGNIRFEESQRNATVYQDLKAEMSQTVFQ